MRKVTYILITHAVLHGRSTGTGRDPCGNTLALRARVRIAWISSVAVKGFRLEHGRA